jgi:hypothetical protein
MDAAIPVGQRFESGDICWQPGWYEFDGYTENPHEPLPALNEMEVLMGRGEVFPPVTNPDRSCFWRLSGSTESRISGVADLESAGG